ncbi:hypothetical protein CTI12_AA621260 [Artemisia annua]|nr:hypothetical protein CTI12_AA621260 [Artemisia annua]
MADWIPRGRGTPSGFVARRTAERGNVTTYHRDPRDIKIERLQQRVQELELHQEATGFERGWGTYKEDNPFVQDPRSFRDDLPAKEIVADSSVWDDVYAKVNPFDGCYQDYHGDNHDDTLLTMETESEPVIWDIGDEEEEYPFVDIYPNFQEEENDVSFWGVVLGVEDELMPVYDTDIKEVELVAEEVATCEDGDDVYIDHVESLMIQHVLSDDFAEDINLKLHELLWSGKSIIIKVSKSSFKFLIGKRYQEAYTKSTNMVYKLGSKTIKTRGRVFSKKGRMMQGIINQKSSIFQILQIQHILIFGV